MATKHNLLEIFDNNPIDFSRVATIIAWEQFKSGDFADGLTMATLAVDALTLTAGTEDTVLLAQALNVQGECQRCLGNKKEALASYDRAWQVARKTDDAEARSSILSNRGIAYLSNGQVESAVASQTLALKIDVERGDPGVEAFSRNSLAAALRAARRPEEALNEIDKAIALRRRLKDWDELLLSLDLRASLLRDLGRREEAIRAYEEALALGDRVSNALSLRFALFGLGELHSENDDRARALPFMLQAIEKVEDLRKRVKDPKLLANFDERYCAYYGQTIKMLLENRNHAEALQWIDHVRARSFHDELAQIRPEEEIIPITGAALRAEVARHLMADEALLEIWLDKGTSYTFTTYPDGTIEPEVYPSEKVDENEGWADLLRAGPLRTRSAQIMSAPFASLMRPRFEKYRCFYVVPHGIQFFLPIAVSRNANEHKYLCQSHEIVVLPSVPLLLASKRKHRHATSRALVIGDPDGSLPHAREEATLVGQLLKCPIMTDDATVDNVLETLNGRVFDVVHFACHYVHSVDPNRCGLVMAAGSILTLDRLAALRLQANLVCTASCWSGLTPFSHSNNMTGLNRMLFLAGVNTILSSTGPVDDRASSLMFPDFYRLYRAVQAPPPLWQNAKS